MEPEYLIDTNAVIDYLGNNLPDEGMNLLNNIIDAKPAVSIITKIEVLGFNVPSKHYQLLENFITDITVIDLTPAIVNQTITIRKTYKTKLPDAIIAATALVHNLILVTRNVSDFTNISGLRLVNPHLLKTN